MGLNNPEESRIEGVATKLYCLACALFLIFLCVNQFKSPQIAVDPSNPETGIKEALLKARESEAIAKYLGTSESKVRAG